MKYFLLISMLFLAMGCTDKTSYGKCVGAFDEKDPKLVYKLDADNLAVGLIFFELVIPPIKVIADETFCPVGVK